MTCAVTGALCPSLTRKEKQTHLTLFATMSSFLGSRLSSPVNRPPKILPRKRDRSEISENLSAVPPRGKYRHRCSRRPDRLRDTRYASGSCARVLSRRSPLASTRGSKNIVRQLMGRQLTASAAGTWARQQNTKKFQTLRLQGKADTYEPDNRRFTALQNSIFEQRSKVIEILATDSLIFALTQAGACAAYRSGLFR